MTILSKKEAWLQIVIIFLKATVKRETFKGENFEVLWLFVDCLSGKFGDMAYFGGTSEQSMKVFSTKIFSTYL